MKCGASGRRQLLLPAGSIVAGQRLITGCLGSRKDFWPSTSVSRGTFLLLRTG
jgi:hypothetical protein